MGRHSSPDDDDDVDDDIDSALLTEDVRAVGRHAESRLPAVPLTATTPPPVAPQRGRAGHSTAADLALVRAHRDVRARCAAGLLVPFVIWAAVLTAVGGSGRQWALWVFVPLIVAGVLVGTFLDAGHRRYPPT